MKKSAEPSTPRPAELSRESQQLFRELCEEYAITDSGGREVLRSGLRALDQAVAAEARIAVDGAVQKDRFGQLRAHPLLAVARDFRVMWQSALRQLNLSIGEPPKVGRPEGS